MYTNAGKAFSLEMANVCNNLATLYDDLVGACFCIFLLPCTYGMAHVNSKAILSEMFAHAYLEPFIYVTIICFHLFCTGPTDGGEGDV